MYERRKKNPLKNKNNSILWLFLDFSSPQQQFDIIIIGAKEIFRQIRNVPNVEKLVGQANVSLECDVNGVE